MDLGFFTSAAIAVGATLMAITRPNAMHALLYLIVSLLAVAVVFLLFGAPFAAALEIIVYAGAIMVLFVFVVMMLNLGKEAAEREREWLAPKLWLGPSALSLILLAEMLYVIFFENAGAARGGIVDARAVAGLLFGPYLLAVEIASMLLLAGLVGAYRLGRFSRPRPDEYEAQPGADTPAEHSR
jgi:NADH-quinone oxidoreductase subunit J